MTMEGVTLEREEIDLGHYISLLSLLFHSVLLLFCGGYSIYSSSSFAASFGVLLCSYPALFYCLLSSILTVLLSKRLALSRKPPSKPSKSTRGGGDSSGSTFLQRSVRRFKRLLICLSPLKTLFKGSLQFLAFWGLSTVAIFCLGAELLNVSTWKFSLLLSFLSLKPILLGEDLSFFGNLSRPKEQVHLNVLLQQSIGTFLGAWVGAFPIPLDWDRDWQDWPLTCVIGAHLGALISYGLTSLLTSYPKRLNRGSRKSSRDQKWKKLA